MNQRINIMLPEETLAVLERVAPRGNRSRFISRAVLHYVETQGKESLREKLKAGYLANADENLRIAAEWFPLEEEAWQTSRAGQKAKNKK
jgi:metal-responsive CopG/Arc/MetJ family transcriptional regulator